MKTAPRVIVLKGTPQRKEANAAGAITPGMLVKVNSSGLAVVHDVAGGHARRLFADMDDAIGNTIDDAYAADDRVQMLACVPGNEINALLAASQVVAVGDPLVSNGDGTLKKLVPAAGGSIVGYALSAVTTTTAVKRIAVEVAEQFAAAVSATTTVTT